MDDYKNYLKEISDFNGNFKLKNLFHITKYENLESIIKYKHIFSRNNIRGKGFNFNDLSNPNVQNRRHNYHDKVPLFFNPCNAMWFDITKQMKTEDFLSKFSFIAIHPNIIFENDLLFFYGNAATGDCERFSDLEEFKKTINSEWNFNLLYQTDYSKIFKKLKSSECLIPNSIPLKFFYSIYVGNDSQNKIIRNLLTENNCDIPVFQYSTYARQLNFPEDNYFDI